MIKNITAKLIRTLLFTAVAALAAAPAQAQTATVTNNWVAYDKSTTGGWMDAHCGLVGPVPFAQDNSAACPCYDSNLNSVSCSTEGATRICPLKPSGDNRSYITSSTVTASGSGDPWVNSGLIEYDQPYQFTAASDKKGYPNHCLTICGQVTCSNPIRKVQPPDNSSGGEIMYESSGDFPIQSVLFEIFKYQTNVNPYNPDSTPPIRTIALYPVDGSNICRGVDAWVDKDPNFMSNGKRDTGDCCSACFPQAGECRAASGQTCGDIGDRASCTIAKGCSWDGNAGSCNNACHTLSSTCTSDDITSKPANCQITTAGASSDCNGRSQCLPTYERFFKGFSTGMTEDEKNVIAYEQCSSGSTVLNFCAPWDGTYEIDGEFGKTNGQFGYRTTISSKWPGDDISTPDIDLTHTIVYPGNQQIPIQIDVTNVHSVRSSATMIGAVVAVAAQPYKISYRLSKDAQVRIQITASGEGGSEDLFRNLVNWEPRDGEGTPMNPGDVVTTEVDQWDGRNDEGLLMPFGNYTVSIQAYSQDEWTGFATPVWNSTTGGNNVDLSRTVTRQLSLDPLKITDIKEEGLSKTSTAYAMLSYMLTEAATVHVEIYTPGTSFDDVKVAGNANFMNGDIATTLPGTVNNGYKLAEIIEQKAGRLGVNTKWDGRCWFEDGCVGAGYSVGSALPDGDYVYLIWAEIPYPGTQTVTVNGNTWNGVKTRMLHNGHLPINRGLPEILIQPAGYSTIGSSPTAFGLDPFIFRFSLSRDAIVDVNIVTSSYDSSGSITGSPSPTNTGPFLVKKLLSNTTVVANQMNSETWDGRDANGRYVSPGVYLLEVRAKDSLFPDKEVISTIEFPIDMFRVVDVTTAPIVGDATSQAAINYMLSKSMDVRIDIYDKDVIIPSPGHSSAACPVVCPAGRPADNCIHSGTSAAQPEPLKSYFGTRPGEGVMVTETWDGYKYQGETQYAIMDDGLYPYIICARTEAVAANYYTENSEGDPYPVDGSLPANQLTPPTGWMYASDKPTGYITVARGPVYFTTIDIKPSSPQLFYSSETIQIPAYEIQFAVTRTANVKVEIISTEPGMCMNGAPAGTVCRTITQLRPGIMESIYDPLIINKLYWDGKDERGEYVRKSGYEFRFTAVPYPATTQQPPTIRSQIVHVNNFQVFDRFIWDVSQQNQNMGKFAYQVSVPMKVAIQILKPGTKIADPTTGALLDPVDGTIVNEQNINRVLVKAIIGVRPHLVALEDIWDGTDFAGQKVPDGFYPFRYVTVTDSYYMDSIDGHVKVPNDENIADYVADWDKFINLGVINVANGDSFFADLDWKSDQVTMFFPNPLRQSKGQFEITKIPAPGQVTIKIYNIAGDLVRDSGYQCITARGEQRTLEAWNSSGGLSPDMGLGRVDAPGTIVGGRNFALRCEWDKTNNHGKAVARGLYYAIMELNPTHGNAAKSQKVVKILIP